jgi:hypothetical protein
VGLESARGGIEAPLDDRAHQVEAAAWRIGLVTEARVGGADGETEAAVHAGEQSVLLSGQSVEEGGAGPVSLTDR